MEGNTIPLWNHYWNVKNASSKSVGFNFKQTWMEYSSYSEVTLMKKLNVDNRIVAKKKKPQRKNVRLEGGWGLSQSSKLPWGMKKYYPWRALCYRA